MLTIKDLIKELLELDNLELQIAFDATSLVDNAGINGGHPNITEVKTTETGEDEYVLLKSDEI